MDEEMQDETTLIAGYIEPVESPETAHLRGSAISVWAIVEYWHQMDYCTARVTQNIVAATGLTPAAVAAALAYYRHHHEAFAPYLALDAA